MTAPWDDARAALPDGSVVRLARRTRLTGDGSVLVGGAPARVARLAPAARELLRGRSLEVTDDATRALAARLVASGQADPDPRTLPAPDTAGVTVVIPAYGRSRPLGRLLDSVRADLGDVRVIVVDDGSASSDAEEIALAARERRAEVVALPENSGPADARNAGLVRVTTPFVLFVDTDVQLRPGAVATMLAHFADPRLALAAPRVVGARVRRPNAIQRYEQARSSLDHGVDGGLVRPHSPLSWVSTTCVLARVNALHGGFGPGMRVAEDVDLVWRLDEAGWRVRYEPLAEVRHEHRRRTVTWLSRKFVYGTGAASLERRHGPLAAPAVLAPWAAGLVTAVAAQRRWSPLAAGGLLAWAFRRTARRVRPVGGDAPLAARLTAQGASAALTQGSAIVVRHWWPAFAVAAVFSRRARRLVVVAGLVDAAIEYVRLRPRLDPLRFLVLRRLDDLAYGAGVWWGAIRSGSLRCLAPFISATGFHRAEAPARGGGARD